MSLHLSASTWKKARLYDSVAGSCHKMPEIVRLNYTTGNYSMFAEIVCKDINQLRFVLHDELQKIKGIERTETFIILDEKFQPECAGIIKNLRKLKAQSSKPNA